ncbi:hypothetical protein [Streptomyces sp. HM190]|nr:hypothetical protein [Streptomyces sp. HM190]
MTLADREADADPRRAVSVPHRRLTLANSVLGAVIVALDGTVLTIARTA